MGALGDFSWSDPESYFDTGYRIVKMAAWADEPMTQIVTNIVIIAALMLVSSVGFVVGIPLALAALALLTVGVLRLGYQYVLG